jgi:hypothetical protein
VDNAGLGQTIILSSTTFVGSTAEFPTQPLKARGLVAGQDVFIAFSPERIDPGNAAHGAGSTPRVVSGVTDECTRRARAVLRLLTPLVHEVSSAEAAELTKPCAASGRTISDLIKHCFPPRTRGGTTSQQRSTLPAYRQGRCLSSGLDVQVTRVLTRRPATTRSVPDGSTPRTD